MKKEPISLRYIHILGTIIFFSSISSLVILLTLYLNQRLQTSLKDYDQTLSLNPLLTSLSSRRVAMSPRSVVMRNETDYLKVAFMFMTRGNLLLAPLWELFFKGHEGFIRFMYIPRRSSLRSTRKVQCFTINGYQTVEWGKSSMMDAERRLLSHALLEPSNARFILLSETCIPLFNFTTIYTYLTRSTLSFVGSFDDPRPMGRGRYTPKMLPHVSLSDWRKRNQWFEISRKIAVEIVSDHRFYAVFKAHCRPPCYIDEHYIPTLVNKICPDLNSNLTVTWVDWSRGGSHPGLFVRKDIRVGFLDRIRFGENCSYEGEVTNVCFLFARKFHVSALEPLMKLAPYLYGV